MATTYYANPAGGNWSAAIWGTDPGGPFNLTWPDTTDEQGNAVMADEIIVGVKPCPQLWSKLEIEL